MVASLEEYELPPQDDNVAARTLDSKTGKPPETRLGPSWAIRDRVAEMVKQDITRSKLRGKMQRWVDGARPFDSRKLEKLGQADRTNFNPREAEGMADTAKTPYYGLVFRNPQFAVIECDYGSNPQLRSQWSSAISRSFHRSLEEWPAFDYHMQLKQWQMVYFGIGLALFPDAEDWQWKSCKLGNFLVPNKTPALIDELPEACYFRRINPVDLYKVITKEGAADNGWFVERVKAWIIKKAPERFKQLNSFGQDWNEEWVNSLRRGDVMWNGDSSQLSLTGYLIKEFDGKVSHCLLVDDGQQPDPNSIDKDDDLLLFKKVGCFDSFDQVCQPFFFDIGTGEWDSIKGLGPKITDNTMASARLICGMIDGARRGASPIFQAQDSTSEQISQLIEIGGGTIVPSGLALQQNRISESLQGPMAVRRELQDINQTNVGMYTQRLSQENQEPTLGQAQLNARQQIQLSEAATDRYCKSGDRLYTEMARRMALMGIRIFKKLHADETTPPDDYEFPDDNQTPSEKGAYYFVRRCIEQGVPIEALEPKWFCSVKMMRGVGSGSPAAMDVATSQGLQLLPILAEPGRNVVTRMRVAFLFGQQLVDSIVPPLDQVQLPDDQASMAVLENNALRTRDGEVLLTPTQNHAIHFAYHYGDMAHHVEQLKAGQANPVEVLVHLHQGGAHCWAHLNELEGDPSRKAQFDQMQASLIAISKLTDQLQQQVVEAMQSQQQAQQQQSPQMPPEMVAAVMKAKGDIAIKTFVAQGKLAIQAKTQEAKNRLKDLDQAQQMQLRNRAAAAAPPIAAAA